MATGILGSSNLSTATYETVYTVPAGKYTVMSINMVNRGNQAVTVRLAIADTATPTNPEFIEYETELLGKGVLERTGIVVDAGKQIVAYTSGANISAVVMGIETPTA